MVIFGKGTSKPSVHRVPWVLGDSKIKEHVLLISPTFWQMLSQYVGVSKNSGTPKSWILIGVSIIFTIHFGGKIPLFLVQHPCVFFWQTIFEHQPGPKLYFPRLHPGRGPFPSHHLPRHESQIRILDVVSLMKWKTGKWFQRFWGFYPLLGELI